MKRTQNSPMQASGAYCAPQISFCSVAAERGYSASMPGVTIDPWTKDEDSLEF